MTHDRFKRCLSGTILVLVLFQASSAFGVQPPPSAGARASQRGAHHHKVNPRTRRKPGAVVHHSSSRFVATATNVLMGDTAVEWQYDALLAGRAEAFRLQAGASGIAGAVHLYISAQNAASAVTVGVYSSAGDHPGTLMGTGSASATAAGTWTTVSTTPIELVTGRSYWLAILGNGGVLRYRDRAGGPCPSETSARRGLRALPTSWSTGRTYSDCPLSAYVTTSPLPSAQAAVAFAPSEEPTLVQELRTAAPPAAPLAASSPSISGAAIEGQTLTASSGSWSGSPTSYGYQWEDCNSAGEDCTNVTGATGASYKLAAGDVGHAMRVVVTASNAGGSAKASSKATATVTPAPAAPTNSEPPAVGGSVVEAQTLSASNGSWNGSPTSYSYQWEDCNAAGRDCTSISGATSASYRLAASDVGHTIRVVVTASNTGGSTKASSQQTGVVVPLAPSNTQAPEISGTPEEGQSLASTNGSWTGTQPITYSYQWEDCNGVGEGCTNVSGATGASYKLAAGDVGHAMRVVVTASNAGGSAKATSKATASVSTPTAAPTNTELPTVSGSAIEVQTLSASNGRWNGSPTSYTYQWQDCNTSGEACTSISGAASASYKLAAGDVGHTIRALVTASNAGGSTKASSRQTAVIAPLAPANTKAPEISGTTEEGQTLTAAKGTWTGNPNEYGYQWQDCNSSGEACSKIGGATSAMYKLGSGDLGHRIRVAVTASNAGGSTQASSPPSGTVVAESVGSGSDIYVAQAGAGNQSGEGSCSNAHSLAWLNNGGNWGAGAGKVAPGATVALCGTLTEPVEVTGNGSAGKPVTILFTAGAKIAMGGEGCPGSGCINLGENREYVTIDGGTDGVIENTDRGTKKNKSETATTAIRALGPKHISIENLEIANLYVAESGDQTGNTEIRGILIYGGEAEYVAIDNDVLHDMGWAVNVSVNGKSNHIAIEHDTVYHATHGFSPTGGTEGGEVGSVVIAHDRFYGNGNWEDGAADTNHVDALHCYTGNGRTGGLHWGPAPKGLYIYDNYFTVEAENVTAPIYIEGTTGPQCGDRTSNFWIFNNVLTAKGSVIELNNGLLSPYSGEEHIFNNTLIGNSSGKGGCIPLDGSSNTSANVQFKNNISSTCKTLIDAEKSHLAAGGVNYNLYANGGSANEAFVCNADKLYFSQFSSWESCIEGDLHSVTASSAKLDLAEAVGVLGKPEAGSPALGAGTNLTSLCSSTPEEALCKNINGEARPATGAWNIGAY